MPEDLLSRLRSQFLQLVKAVEGYPTLSDEEISKRIDADGLGMRDLDRYPEPFPRDGSLLLPGEGELNTSIAEGLGRLVPNRTSLGYRLWLTDKALRLALDRVSSKDRELIFERAVTMLRELDEEWETVVPIAGLDLKGSLLQVGPVGFHPIEENDDFSRWRARTVEEKLKDFPFLASGEGFPPKYPGWLDTLSPNVRSYARVTAKGDSLLASERALGLVSEAIDVLRVFLSWSESAGSGGGWNFGPVGHGGIMKLEYGLRMLREKGKPVEPLDELFSLEETRYVGVAARYMVTLDEGTLTWVNARGLGLFGQAMMKATNERSDLESRIMGAAAWFSQGVSSRDRIDRFLKFVFALDALLGGRSGENGGTQIAERLAFLLGSDTEHRRTLKKRAKEYFKKRGPLAHGKRAELDFSTLFSLELDCKMAIQQLALSHLQRETFDAFLEWAEEQKFSTPPSK